MSRCCVSRNYYTSTSKTEWSRVTVKASGFAAHLVDSTDQLAAAKQTKPNRSNGREPRASPASAAACLPVPRAKRPCVQRASGLASCGVARGPGGRGGMGTGARRSPDFAALAHPWLPKGSRLVGAEETEDRFKRVGVSTWPVWRPVLRLRPVVHDRARTKVSS